MRPFFVSRWGAPTNDNEIHFRQMKYPAFSTDLGVSEAHPVEFSVTSTVSLHTVDVLFAVLDILEKHRIRVAKQNAEQPAANVSVLFQLHHPQ